MTSPASADLAPVAGPASAIGLVTIADDIVLDAWYPHPALSEEPADVAGIHAAIGSDDVRSVAVRAVSTSIEDLARPPVDTADAYLRLHLLSHRLVRPRTINLDGIFGLLPIVAWTSLGPVPLARLDQARLHARTRGQHLTVHGVDRFPRMVDYVVPSGVGGARCILLSEGLLEAYSDDEIEVVVAHELAHAAHGDVRLTLAVQGALTLVGLGGLAHIWPQVASWLGASTPPTAEHVSALVLAGWAWQGVTAPVLHALARQQERRADAFALAVTGRPDAFLTALRRLTQEHLADDSAPALVYWWTQSHPRIAERVAMAEAFTRQSSTRATLSAGRM